MKKPVISLAVLATLSTASYAQSTSNITIYGQVDLGLALTSNGAASASNNTMLSSGIRDGSTFGFKGVEDIGGGLKALFVLEAGIDADTGAAKNIPVVSSATPASPGGTNVSGLFNKRSVVGLEGNFGSVTLGRDYTPLYYTAKDSDPLTLGLWGNAQEGAQLSGTGSDRFARASNAVFYLSPDFGGFRARVMYSLGSESAGGAGAPPSDANRMWGLGGQYLNGGLLISAAYQELKLPIVSGSPATFTGATGTRKDSIIGAKYRFGDYSVGGGYMVLKQPTPNSDGKSAYLGGTAKIGSGTALIEMQRIRQDAAVGGARTGNVFGLGYVYPLSKRGSLYASYGQLTNSATASFALVANDPVVAPGAAGATVKATAVGILHKF